MMKTNINWKIMLRLSAWGLLILSFMVSVGFSDHSQSVMPCQDVLITVDDSIGHSFVIASDIDQLIRDKFGSLEGKAVGSINIALLEKIVNANPFISDAEVFSTIDGKINIRVKQRTPVLRVINNDNESFYIDNEGNFMPYSDRYTASVPVASGNIPGSERDQHVLLYGESNKDDSTISISKIDELFRIASFINNNEFWNAQIEQLYVDEKGEVELIPRVGNHKIIFGTDENMEKKFSKLLVFYREGLNKTGWNKYSTINLKYEDQVVCTKN
jgi:cell division protein FtsQ